MSQKKYGVADYQYFSMVIHSNVIFSDMINATSYLGVCAVSTPYVKCTSSYKCEKNDESNGTWKIKWQILTQTYL